METCSVKYEKLMFLDAFDFKRHQSIARAMREQMRSKGSRDTLMSCTDRSMQRRLKSNAPYILTAAVLRRRQRGRCGVRPQRRRQNNTRTKKNDSFSVYF